MAEQTKPKEITEEDFKQLPDAPGFWPSKEEMDEYDKIYHITVDGGMIKLKPVGPERTKQINGIIVRLMYCKVHHYPAIFFAQVYPAGENVEIEVKLAEWLILQRYPQADWEVMESNHDHVKMHFRRSPNDEWKEKIYTIAMAKELIPNATNTGVGGKQWRADDINMLVNRCKGAGFRMYFPAALHGGVYLKGEIPQEEVPELTEAERNELEFGGLDQPAKPSPVKKETKKADHTDQPEPVKAESKKEIQTMNGTDPDDPPKNESKQTFKGALFNAVTRYQESHPTEMKTLTLAAQMIQESEGLSKEESLFVAIFDGDNHHPTIEDLNQLDGLDLEIATKMIKYWEPHNNEAKLEDAINSAPKKTTTPEHELKYYVVDQCDEVTDKAYKYNCKFVEVNAEFSEHIGEPFYANIFENNLNGEALKQGYIVQAGFYQKGKYWNLYKDAFKIVARD